MVRRLSLLGLSLLGAVILSHHAFADQSSSTSARLQSDLSTILFPLSRSSNVPQTTIPSGNASYLPLVIKAPAPPTSTPTPVPVNPTCVGDANPSAPNVPVAITNVNKAGNPETVTIRNSSSQSINLTNWWICSMHGHQLHAVLSGTLAPGQSIVIVSQASEPIWNNNIVDPAALYRSDGFQVGYRSQ